MKIKITADQIVKLTLSDFNRLRWAVCAIEKNVTLRDSLIKYKATYITDSISLINNPRRLASNSHVLLWDGYNSYLELIDKLPHIKIQTDLVYVYVGSFKELKQALPSGSIPLFADDDFIKFEKVNVSLFFRLFSFVRTGIRSYKNQINDQEKHRQLSRQKSIVFCGLVSPSPQVLDNFLRRTELTELTPALMQLCNLDWQQNYPTVKEVIMNVLEKVYLSKSQNPADLACLYSILNICHRLLVLSYLSSKKCDLFINEYGLSKHIDPYDAFCYTHNLYLDFGSSRGSANWYPRTVDMEKTHKKFIRLRFLHQSQSLLEFLKKTDIKSFIYQRESEALQTIKTFKAMSE